MALTLAKTATKLGLGVGAVYITLDQGVWSSTNQGCKALDKVRTKVLPAANDCFNKVPDVQNLNDTAKNTWNNGIQRAFNGMATAPEVVGDYSKKAVSELRNLTS